MSLPVQKMVLHQPSLEEVAGVLQKGLAKNFSTAEVRVVDCPDLTAKPFDLAEKGLSGKPRILDVGGPDYLRPLVQKDKKYSFDQISELGELPGPGPLLIGAGAGPCHHVGVNSELICNVKLGQGGVNKTHIVKVNGADGTYSQHEEKSQEFSLLGNFYLSEGKPGKVLQIHAKNRTGKENFVECVHKTLTAQYGDQAVGVGGTFLLQSGKANIHVMPDFSKTPLTTEEDIMSWLKFYEMDAPLVHVGEIVSADPENLHLRCEHFHCFSDHGQGGHYHFDTTPSDTSYLGYFNLAEAVYRIDLPGVRNYVF